MVLREIEGLAYEEIAEILETNVGTVKSRLMRGRAAFCVKRSEEPGRWKPTSRKSAGT